MPHKHIHFGIERVPRRTTEGDYLPGMPHRTPLDQVFKKNTLIPRLRLEPNIAQRLVLLKK